MYFINIWDEDETWMYLHQGWDRKKDYLMLTNVQALAKRYQTKKGAQDCVDFLKSIWTDSDFRITNIAATEE